MKRFAAMSATALFAFVVVPAMAEIYASGVVKSIETWPEFVDQGGGYHNQLSVVIEGACIDTGPGGSYESPIAVQNNGSILIRSGRMDGRYAHNSENFRSSFELLMTSLREGLKVSIGDLPSCEDGGGKTINLWTSRLRIEARQTEN